MFCSDSLCVFEVFSEITKQFYYYSLCFVLVLCVGLNCFRKYTKQFYSSCVLCCFSVLDWRVSGNILNGFILVLCVLFCFYVLDWIAFANILNSFILLCVLFCFYVLDLSVFGNILTISILPLPRLSLKSLSGVLTRSCHVFLPFTEWLNVTLTWLLTLYSSLHFFSH